jgi:23S rRNA (cytidine1920-2'-O)/16S rRNA (cytidine1409-2'-O)-methyltransferase
VYAVEVGYGQLAGRLRADPRVVNMERTNLAEVVPGMLQPPPSLVTLDLSYLSLTAALPLAAALLAPPGDVLALLKPLFEVDDPQAGRTGHIDDPGLLVAALRRVLEAGVAAGLAPAGVAKLALRPRHGVAEFFVHLTSGAARAAHPFGDAELVEIVASAGIGPTDEDEAAPSS